MEDSIDSMSDNGCDNDTPLKQVVELCSLLAGKGLQFSISVRIKNSFVFSLKSEKSGPSQGTRRSPSMLVGRKEKEASEEEGGFLSGRTYGTERNQQRLFFRSLSKSRQWLVWKSRGIRRGIKLSRIRE